GELPTQLEANLRTLDRLQAELTASQELIQKLTDRGSQLDLAAREYLETGRTDDTHRPKGDPAELSLKEMERHLVTLQAEYKETYPDIVLLKERIRKLREHHRENAVDGDDSEPGKSGNDPYLSGIRKNRLETKKEIIAIKERQARIQHAIKDLETRVEHTPQ